MSGWIWLGWMLPVFAAGITVGIQIGARLERRGGDEPDDLGGDEGER